MTENEFNKLKNAAWNEAMDAMSGGLSSGDCTLEYKDYIHASIKDVWNDAVNDAIEAELATRTRDCEETEREFIFAEISDVLEDCYI